MSKIFTLDNFKYIYGRIKEIYATQDALGQTQDQLDATKADLLTIQEGVGSVENELNSLKDSAITQDELETAISEAGVATFVTVDELPETGLVGTIYLLKQEKEPVEGEDPEPTFYIQYIYQDNEWREIGQAKINMDNYVSKDELEFAVQSDIDAIMNPVVEEEPEGPTENE